MFRLIGYEDSEKHELISQDTALDRTWLPSHCESINTVTDKQYVLAKLKYPDVEILGFYSYPLDLLK